MNWLEVLGAVLCVAALLTPFVLLGPVIWDGERKAESRPAKAPTPTLYFYREPPWLTRAKFAQIRDLLILALLLVGCTLALGIVAQGL